MRFNLLMRSNFAILPRLEKQSRPKQRSIRVVS